jgi:GDPmannose 4,6-dehydratase
MKIIIFGASGQDAYYLNKVLLNNTFEVLNVSRYGCEIAGDVGDHNFVSQTIRLNKPKYIFHFAANSTTNHIALFENHQTICSGTLNILEAVRLYSPNTKVFLSGSAMQFKNEGVPISEATPFEASSPYAVSRIHSTYAGRYYRSKFGMQVYTGYFFNHDSPLRSEHHVNQKIVRAVQRIVKGSEERLSLGNIDVEKEFGFAGDTVRAVWLLVNQEKFHEAVIGTGISYSIKHWLNLCFSTFGLNWEDHVDIDSSYVPEYTKLVSNPSLIKTTGWNPKTSIEQLAELMLSN